MPNWRSYVLLVPALLLATSLPSTASRAETISSALARAYIGNPDLNQQRASTRATDETVARANAAFRPQITGTGSVGYNRDDLATGGSTSLIGGGAGAGATSGTSGTASGTTGAGGTSSGTTGTTGTTSTTGNTAASAASGTTTSNTLPTSAAVTVTQNLFNGNRSANGVRQAESQVLQSRETTRNTEQNTLQNGATAYMNVLRDTAILELNKNNITVLEEQLRQTRDRFNVGEVTRTDVAQAESSLATARSNYFTAQANLSTDIGNYRQIIGVEPRPPRGGAAHRSPAAPHAGSGDRHRARRTPVDPGGLSQRRRRPAAGPDQRGDPLPDAEPRRQRAGAEPVRG